MIDSHALKEKEFGWFLHGPLYLEKDIASGEFPPPVQFSSTTQKKIFRLDSIDTNNSDMWSGKLKVLGDAIAPSTLYPLEDGEDGESAGFLVAEGNPFFVDMTNQSMQVNRGGITAMTKDKCTTLFPTKGMKKATGQVANTVMCHPKSGVCFFSIWKFYDDSIPEMMYPDCLHYCVPDSMSNPTECVQDGVMEDENGKQICHEKGVGGVHGFTIGRSDKKNSNSFDMLLVMTGGADFDKGESSIRRLKVVVKEGIFDKKKTVTTVESAPFGVDLTKDSIPEGFDAGCDHAWVDESGHVWVTTFRKHNNGLHLLTGYDEKGVLGEGQLIASVHGFEKFNDYYTYSAGLHGFGAVDKAKSMISMATICQWGMCPGQGVLFMMDITAIGKMLGF